MIKVSKCQQMYTVWTILTKRCPAYRKSKVSTKWEGPILRACGAEIFKWRSGGGGGEGELMQMCKHEQTRGVWGYAVPRKFQI